MYFKTGQNKATLQEDLVRSMLGADSSIDTFLCGDFNFVESSEDTTGPFASPPAAFLDAWANFKAKFSVSEVPHSAFTWFHLTADPTSPHSQASRLDRFLVPSSLFSNPLVTTDVSIFSHPSNYRPHSAIRTCFSDHLPIALSFHGLATRLPHSSRIPQWVAESPEFASALTARWVHPGPDANPWRVLKGYKAALFAAADTTRRSHVAVASAALLISWHIKLLHLISRLPQDLQAISTLLSRHEPLNSLVHFDSGVWTDCGLLVAVQNLLVVPQQSSPGPGFNAVKHLSATLPCTRARLPLLKLDADSPPVSDDRGKSAIAYSYWSRIWAARPPPPPDSADEFLRSYTKQVDASSVSAPDLDAVLDSIRSSNNSTPGPDGIPFAAWRAAPALSAAVLFGVLDALLRGTTPCSGFNHGFLFLLPKKESGLVSDTRPISVTNTDNRLLASTVARAIMPAVSTFLDPAQKGFLARVNGHSHTEDLNEFFYQGVATNTQRYVFLLDTAKAFDSIDHMWIFKVLEKAGFPIWLRHFVRCSLHDVKVAPFFGGPPSCYIPIERGVKQGCPLSPLLFIISYDPLLTALRSVPTVPVPAVSLPAKPVLIECPTPAVPVSTVGLTEFAESAPGEPVLLSPSPPGPFSLSPCSSSPFLPSPCLRCPPTHQVLSRQVPAHQVRARQVRARYIRPRQVRVRQVLARPVRARQVRPRQVWVHQVRAHQARARQAPVSRLLSRPSFPCPFVPLPLRPSPRPQLAR